ncbi:hypothetical protein ACFLWR_00350 [Chloroflexota bacterium]
MLVATALIAQKFPATGYELSIYDNTPTLIWIFWVFSMAGGVTIIVHQAITKGYKESNFWIIGLLLIIFTQVFLHYLPYIRGYTQWRGDLQSHVGMVTDILSLAHFGSYNFYPIVHSLLAEIILITGIPILTVVMLSAILLVIIYASSIYLLAIAVLSERGQQLLAIAAIAGMPTFLGIAPIYFSILLFPLIFYLYFKRSSQPYTILLILLLIMYPFLHIFSTLFLILSLVTIVLSTVIYMFIVKRRTSDISGLHLQDSFNLIAIVSIILITWVLSFQVFHKNLQSLWEQIFTGVAPNVIEDMATMLGKINIQGIDFIILLFKIYGVAIIFIVLSLITGIILVRQIHIGNVNKETRGLFGLLSIFLFMGVLYLLYLLGVPGFKPIQADRVYYVVMIFTPIFVGFGLYELVKNVRFRYLASTAIICIIMLASGLATFSFYASPYVIRPNNQVTIMDMTGMEWFIERKSETVGSVNIMTPPGRFAVSILGMTEARQRADLDRGRYSGGKITDHFNYNTNNSLGISYVEDKYSVITKFDRVLYTELWEEVDRFNYDDFEKLESDTTTDKLYANGELDIYFIHRAGSE